VISPVFSLVEFQTLTPMVTFCSVTIQKVLTRGFSGLLGIGDGFVTGDYARYKTPAFDK
jgi:hypothetical protein